MDYQVCDLAPSDLGAAVHLLEELRALHDSSPMEVAQFIADVNDGAVVVSALAKGFEDRLLHLGVRRISALLGSGKVGEQALVNRGFTATTGMVLYEKALIDQRIVAPLSDPALAAQSDQHP